MEQMLIDGLVWMLTDGWYVPFAGFAALLIGIPAVVYAGLPK